MATAPRPSSGSPGHHRVPSEISIGLDDWADDPDSRMKEAIWLNLHHLIALDWVQLLLNVSSEKHFEHLFQTFFGLLKTLSVHKLFGRLPASGKLVNFSDFSEKPRPELGLFFRRGKLFIKSTKSILELESWGWIREPQRAVALRVLLSRLRRCMQPFYQQPHSQSLEGNQRAGTR